MSTIQPQFDQFTEISRKYFQGGDKDHLIDELETLFRETFPKENLLHKDSNRDLAFSKLHLEFLKSAAKNHYLTRSQYISAIMYFEKYQLKVPEIAEELSNLPSNIKRDKNGKLTITIDGKAVSSDEIDRIYDIDTEFRNMLIQNGAYIMGRTLESYVSETAKIVGEEVEVEDMQDEKYQATITDELFDLSIKYPWIYLAEPDFFKTFTNTDTRTSPIDQIKTKILMCGVEIMSVYLMKNVEFDRKNYQKLVDMLKNSSLKYQTRSEIALKVKNIKEAKRKREREQAKKEQEPQYYDQETDIEGMIDTRYKYRLKGTGLKMYEDDYIILLNNLELTRDIFVMIDAVGAASTDLTPEILDIIINWKINTICYLVNHLFDASSLFKNYRHMLVDKNFSDLVPDEFIDDTGLEKITCKFSNLTEVDKYCQSFDDDSNDVINENHLFDAKDPVELKIVHKILNDKISNAYKYFRYCMFHKLFLSKQEHE